MKKSILFFIVFAFISVNCAFASNISISMDNSFIAGQTVSAKVAMDKFALNKLSLLDSSNIKVPVGFLYYNYGNREYLVYFNLPSSLNGNYKLYASDKFVEEGVLKEINASSAFSVSSGNAFTINPAIVKISSSSSSFKINLRHTAGTALDAAVSASDTGLNPVRSSISLAVGETKSLTVNYEASKLKQDAVLRLSSGFLMYEIPVIALKQENDTAAGNVTANMAQNPEDSFERALVTVKNISIIKNSAKENQMIAGAVEFKNVNSLPLHDILFTSSGISSLEFNETIMAFLPSNAVYSQKIWINRQKDAEPGKYFGSITAQSSEGASLTIRMEIEFTPVVANESSENNTSVTITPHSKPKSNITIELVNVSMPMINVSQTSEMNEADKAKNLKIAVALIALLLLLAIGGYYLIRPKVKYKLMGEYAQGLGKPKKK